MKTLIMAREAQSAGSFLMRTHFAYIELNQMLGWQDSTEMNFNGARSTWNVKHRRLHSGEDLIISEHG